MSFFVPIPSAEELTPEELEPLKDALLAHLRSQNATTRDQVDRNFHVTRGERVAAFSFTVHFLVEKRDSQAHILTKPYSEEAAQRIVSPASIGAPKNTGDVWLFPSEERADFTAHTGTYFVPGTWQVKDCGDCFQKGESGCKPCIGRGTESCPTCLGTGKQSCLFCKGAEKVNCLRCGGEGRLASGEVGGRSAACDACGGKGKFPCNHCQGGRLPCPHCQGSGNVTCQKCKGQGKCVCPSCDGRKKTIVGQAFQAGFKPFQAKSSALVVSVANASNDILAMALEKPIEVGSKAFDSGDSLEKQLQQVSLPPSIRGALNEILEREKSQVSSTTRVVKRRLDVCQGMAVRITGYCAGQEFSFWTLPGAPRILAEKDPLASFGSSAAVSAVQARDAGDWPKALTLARESLLFSPDETLARDVLDSFYQKVKGESLFVGVIGGVLAAGAHALWILNFERGLHKAGAVLSTGGIQMVLGPLAALCLVPLLARIGLGYLRVGLLGIVLMALFVEMAALGRWTLEWRPVRTADRKALESEWKGHFKYGIPQVYNEEDLIFLQKLREKFKGTEVDLTRIQAALDGQLALRAQRDRQQALFNSQVAAIVGGNDSLNGKKVLLAKLTNRYRLMGVNVRSGEEAQKNLQNHPKRFAVSSTAASSSHIRIYQTPLPVGRLSAPAPSSLRTKASARSTTSGGQNSTAKSSLADSVSPKKPNVVSHSKKVWWQE